MQGIMDSSPQPVPARKSLKRSASVASLPTPSYTRDRRKRRVLSDSDSEGESHAVGVKGHKNSDHTAHNASDDDNELSALLKAKAERLGALKVEPVKTAKASSSTTSTSAVPLSPPRSKRTTKTSTRSKAVVPEVPTTPPPRRSSRVVKSKLPRDSPENPFLISDKNPAVPLPPRSSSAEHEERPKITYVFRGVKAEFDNPLYGLDPEYRRRSKLPVDDPEYSPDPIVAPRRLFQNKKALAAVAEEDESEDERLQVKPTKLFANKTRLS